MATNLLDLLVGDSINDGRLKLNTNFDNVQLDIEAVENNLSTNYVPKSGGEFTGTLDVDGSVTPGLRLNTDYTSTYHGQLRMDATGRLIIEQIADGVGVDGAIQFGNGVIDVTTGELRVGGNTVYHTGNDGAGSGLDADTVDGQHASNFVESPVGGSVSAIYAGSVAANGTPIRLPTGWSSSNSPSGRYTVTHGMTSLTYGTDYFWSVQPHTGASTPQLIAQCTGFTAGEAFVRIVDAGGGEVANDFSFVLYVFN